MPFRATCIFIINSKQACIYALYTPTFRHTPTATLITLTDFLSEKAIWDNQTERNSTTDNFVCVCVDERKRKGGGELLRDYIKHFD